ncbi:MAG: B12-binding domain-containing radical SAM protein [Deltaproteobacteria bacterium]|nr:B12-binding domain-containing radical SAM protein [Deltaproteobacteria bacterium]
MKILLIQPPIQDFYQTPIRTQPIGLAYLAASLIKEGYEVEILDCQTEKRKSIPTPPELSYLKEVYPFQDRSPFKLYTGFYHFGMGWEEIRKEIEKSKADIFGISSSFTPYHGEALKVAQLIKEWNSKKIVVMGGSHVSCDPEGVLKSPFVDYVILGEGEYRLLSLMGCLKKGKKNEIDLMDGIGYKRNGEIHINPPRSFILDLDSIPPPARDQLDLDRYRINQERSTMIITSRGCPHGCTYCSAHLVMGSSFRMRSPENILQEMVECRERYGIETFDIEDDNFTFDLTRAKRLMALIIKTFGESRLELSAMNGTSFASLDGELIHLMKKAGFHTLNLSYLSTVVSTKERMKRPQPVIEFGSILKEAEKVRLNVIAYAILGIPGQTIEEMIDTLVYLMGERVLIGPSIYYPTPGTPLFERCKKDGILPYHLSQWRSSALPIETKEFDRHDLATLLRLTRVINFIKGKMDQGTLEEGITWRKLFQKIKDKAVVRAQDRMTAWADLLVMLFEERSFFSLRKDVQGRPSFQKEKSSKRVLDNYFQNGFDRPILKTRSD